MRVLKSFAGWVRLCSVATLLIGALSISCGSKKTSASSSATASASARKSAASVAKLALEDLPAPDDIVFFGGIEDVDKLAKPLADMGTALQKPSDLRKELSKIATGDLGLESDHAIDLTKPVRFAMLDPKMHGPRSLTVFFHIESEEALITTTPSNRTMGDKWNAYDWATPSGRVYLNVVGDVAIFTREPNEFIEDETFLEELAVATFPTGITITARPATLVKLYANDFALFWPAIARRGGFAAGQGKAHLAYQRFFELLADVDSLALSINPSDDGLVFTYSMSGRPGTTTEAACKSLEDMHPNTLLPRFPKNALAYLAGSLSPTAIRYLDTAMKRQSVKKAATDLAGKVTAGWLEMLAASTGDVLLGAFPLHDEASFVLMSSLADPEEARAGLGAIQGAYQDPAAVAGLAKLGTKMTIRPNAYKVGAFGVSVMKTETTPGSKVTLDPSNPLLETHALIGADETLFAFGPHSPDILKALVDPKSLKDAPDLGLDKSLGSKRVAKSGAPNPFLIGYMSPAMLTRPPQLNAPDTGGIVLSVGAKGGVLEIDLDVPTAQMAPAIAVLNEPNQQPRKPTPTVKH